MNNVHDTGGMQGYGPVPQPITNERVFKAPWEAHVFAMQMATIMLGVWKPGVIRASIESLPPETYLSASYYQKWLLGLERRLLSSGLISADEIAVGHALRPGKPMKSAPPSQLFAQGLPAATPAGARSLGTASPPAFSGGQTVRAKNLNPPTHTRLPRYVRNHVGVIESVRGVQSLPDVHVFGDVEKPQWVYAVAFQCRELWGSAADPQAKVSVDAWEAYLEAV
jgi:nitrile hydratase beta subunit